MKTFAKSFVQGIPLNRSSPSPLYVQRKALPPVALGRSTAPQHSSFVSRQPSSEKMIGAADTFYNWRSRPELLPRNTSPARSTFSLASTVNLYQLPLPVSATIAQRKLHTQAPLYYDYTEDFDIEEEYCNRADAENPPLPPLLIDGVIHEHKNLSPEVDSLPIRSPGVSVNFRSQDFRSGTETGSRKSIKTTESMIHPMNQSSESEAVLQSQLSCETLNDLTGGRGATSGTFVQGNRSQSPPKGKLTNGHSSKSPTSGSELNSGIRQTPMLLGDQEKPVQEETMGINIIDTMPNRNPSYELLTHLPVFQSPPDQPVSIFPGNLLTARNQHGLDIGSGLEKPGWANCTGIITETERPLTLHVRRHSQAAPSHGELNASRTILRRSASARDERSRYSRFYSIDCGLADLAQLITRFEAVNKSLSLVSEDSTANILTQPFLPHEIPRDNLALNNKKDSPKVSLLESQIPLNKFLSGGDPESLREGAGGCQDQILPEDLIGFNMDKCEGIEIPNFSHRIPRKPLSRSASPILVPEPVVSTARILKLKQSVPQLMKALPPIPLESMGSAQQAALDPSKPLPMRQESEPKLKSNTVSIPVPAEHDSTVTCSTSMRDATLQAINIKTASARPSKFKLKPRLPFSHQPYPLSNIRPWSPDENRPSTNRQPDVRSPITMPRSYAAETTAKFKLKANKTSNPIEGTVRINKEARSHKVVNNLDLRHPRDLFTSPSGFNGMFQQAGRHFSSRKMSQSYEPSLPPNDAHSLNSVVVQGQQDSCLEPLLDLGLPLSDTTYPISSTEVRSFFSDDSSQVQGHNSLRKRISNLRARIPVPYTSRPAVQSGDVVWRERTTVPDVKRFKSSLGASQDNSMITETDVRPRRLRSKVSGWFKDARNVVTGCVRQRNNEELKSYNDSQVVMR